MYKALLGIAPVYLGELDIQPKVSARSLRSNSTVLLSLSPGQEQRCMVRDPLDNAAARLWNGLPQHMRSVTMHLKRFQEVSKDLSFSSAL